MRIHRRTDLEMVRHSNFNPTSLAEIESERRARQARRKIAEMRYRNSRVKVIEPISKPVETHIPYSQSKEGISKRYLKEIQQKLSDQKRAEYEAQKIAEFQEGIDRKQEEFYMRQEKIKDARISMDQIALEVAQKYIVIGVEYSDLFSVRRSSNMILARHEAWYRCKTETTNSLPAIGRYFNGKDHTTILHGIRKYKSYQNGAPLKASLPEHLILPVNYLEIGGDK